MEKLVKQKNWLNEKMVKKKKMVKLENWLIQKSQLNGKIG